MLIDFFIYHSLTTVIVFPCFPFSILMKYTPAGRCSNRMVSSGEVIICVWTITPAALMTCIFWAGVGAGVYPRPRNPHRIREWISIPET